MSEETASDKNVEIWKVKKLIKSLQLARGNGTSMISLIIPPGDQVVSLDYFQNQIHWGSENRNHSKPRRF